MANGFRTWAEGNRRPTTQLHLKSTELRKINRGGTTAAGDRRIGNRNQTRRRRRENGGAWNCNGFQHTGHWNSRERERKREKEREWGLWLSRVVRLNINFVRFSSCGICVPKFIFSWVQCFFENNIFYYEIIFLYLFVILSKYYFNKKNISIFHSSKWNLLK